MKIKIRKALAVLQIMLQLFSPSYLLYLAPAFSAHAQEISSAPQNSAQQGNGDQTEKNVAQAAVQAGSLLSSDSASSALSGSLISTATGQASSTVQQWLSQFGTARVNISTDEHFTLNDSDLDLLLPLYDGKENLFFTQLGGRRHDDRNIINGGLGYRHFSNSWMWGTNIFYDRQISGNQHQRLGLGAELGWDYLKLSANSYFRLSNWMASSRYEDYDERVANGFDIRAAGYLPAYPQLGANVVYEQYYGDSVGLFSDDEDDRQKNPHAITLGLNYTPVPLVTIGVNQKMGKTGENDTQFNLALNWTPGVPLSAQLDPSQVALRRSLMGSRMDLVDRNNNIVLEYRKQDLISLSLPPELTGDEQTKQAITAKVKTKYGLDHIEWHGDTFFSHGGKITASSSPEQFIITLPAWQSSGVNNYTLSAIAWDKKGNASNSSDMEVMVSGVDINTLQSSTTVAPTKVPADGSSTATVTVTLQTSSGQPATGMASRMSATLLSSDVSAVKNVATGQNTVAHAPVISAFTESSSGRYTAIITSGTTPDTLTIQPLIDGTVKLASAKLIEEATVILPQLTGLDASATSAIASGNAPIILTAHVVDQYGKALQGAVIDWTADNAQAKLSAAQSSSDAQGNAQIQVTSVAVITTVITAQLEQGNALNSPSLTFTADSTTAKVTSVDSEKDRVIANNTDTDTVTANVTDSYNHPLQGVKVNWTVEKTDNTPVSTNTSETDSQGNAVLNLKSAKTGTVTVTADINGKNPQETDPITFVADASTEKVSKVTLNKTQAVANGTDSITYEAIVTDASGNPVQSATVNWSTDNQDAKLSRTQTTSDATGKSQIQVTSQKVGDVVITAQTSDTTAYQADKATFIADASTAKVETINSDRQSALANGSDGIVISAAVTDTNGNPVPNVDVSWQSSPETGQLSVNSSKTDASGIAKVTLTSQAVATYSVTAGINGSTKITSGLSFIADSSTAHLDKLTASTQSVLADGTSAITLTASVIDQTGHPVKNEQINWSADNDKAHLSDKQTMTDESGQAQIQVTSTDVITTVITAQHNQAEALHSEPLNFTADLASAKVTAIDSEKQQVVANNTDTDTVTAQVRDDYNHPLNGVTVNWHVTKTDGTSAGTSTSVTDSAGNAVFTLKSAKTGVVTVSADINGANAKETDPITFMADSSTAKVSLITLSKSQALANGTDAITYEATITDATGNPVQNTKVNWSADNTDAKLSSGETTSDANGKSQITVTSLKSGDVIITAQTTEATAMQADKASFIADASTAKATTIASDKQSAVANGTDAITISATVMDANNNLLSDADVSWSVTAQGTSATGKLSAQSSKTNAQGVAQVQLTSQDVAKFTVSASINGTAQSKEDLSFVADNTTAHVTSLTADKTAGIVADKDTVTLTAVVMDAGQHPVPGVTVNWSSSESNSSLTPNSSVTDDQGKATTTFSSLKAGNIDVTATSGSSNKILTLEVIGNVDTAQFISVAADKTEAVADGADSVVWTAKVADANDNPLGNMKVKWQADNTDVTLSGASSNSESTGEATISGTSLKSGNVTVTASLDSPTTQKAASAVSFVGNVKTAKMISLTPSTDHTPVSTTPVTYTAVVHDANDNPVKGGTVSWTTNLNTLSSPTSDTDANGKATIKLSGGNSGTATVTATINGSSMTNKTVDFTTNIFADWVITGGSSKYTGGEVTQSGNMGFLPTGKVQGPTSLVSYVDYSGKKTKLVVPMKDDAGATRDVVIYGQRKMDCGSVEFNNAVGCESRSNLPVLFYSSSDNPDLPAGHYTAVITFDGKDLNSNDWALSYFINTSLTVQ